MPKRVARRIGSLRSKAVRVIGWIVLLAGFVPMWQFFYPILQTGDYRIDGLSDFFAGFAFLFFGAMLVVVARQSEIRWFCSRCNKELRNKNDRACLQCMTLLD